jgi:uncharacterized protein
MAQLARTLLALAIASVFPAYAGAEKTDTGEALYKAEIIVTGTGEKERARGFREGLKEIFIKLTGDASLEDGAKLDPFLNDAARYIREYTYEDRMKHLPIRDEQGTRDRPHFLRMTADADAVGITINSLGLAIWRDRPEIEAILTVKDFKHSFIVGAQSEPATVHELLGYPIASSHYDGYEQREVLKSIEARRGLAIHLPHAAEIDQKAEPGHYRIDRLFGGQGDRNAVRYRGDLTVLPSGFWRLKARAWGTKPDGTYADAPQCFSFDISEVSFDTALRRSLEAFSQWLRYAKNATHCGLQ